MPRETKLALWPEQIDYYPLLGSWRSIINIQTLDFTYCSSVSACGLAASALNLSQVCNAKIRKNKVQEKKMGQYEFRFCADEPEIKVTDKPEIKTIEKSSDNIIKTSQRLGFFNCIAEKMSTDLKRQYCAPLDMTKPVISTNAVESFPILRLEHAKYLEKPRDMVEHFHSYVIPIFDYLSGNQGDKINQLIHILDEIIKNIADHAQADGIIGIDCQTVENKKKISIIIGDEGPGIYMHMRDYMLLKKSWRLGKLGFPEVYRYALQNEVTSSENPDNYGCGMSTIINNALALNINLSVFDADTRLILSSLPPIEQSSPSHNQIWRSSLRCEGKKPFFYFIRCEGEF